MSSTQPGQDDQFVLGGYITSGVSVYQVESFLGCGTYGKVVKCTRMDDKKTVAIKIMKWQPFVSYEVEALKKIKSLDPEECNLVQWHSFFIEGGNIYLEFEHLDKSLFNYIWGRQTHHLYLKEIRPIVQQLASALSHLKTVGIVHGDLKLENVMLVDQLREPYRVKIIDFGLALDVSSAKVGSCIQSCAYRSPEIILGLPFSEAVDMWSLGCIAAAMYLSTLLYPGSCEYEVMRCIVEIVGQPPDSMLSNGQKTSQYFEKCLVSWKLKTPEKVQGDKGIKLKDMRELALNSLDDIQHVWGFKSERFEDNVVEAADRLVFVDMLKGMLQLEPAKRMTPTKVLDHDFISMQHFARTTKHNKHVSSCFQLMDICVNKNSISEKYRTSYKSSSSSKREHRAVLDVASKTTSASCACTVKSNVSRTHEYAGSPKITDRTSNAEDLSGCHISDNSLSQGKKRSPSKCGTLIPTRSQSAVNKSQFKEYNWTSSTKKQNRKSSTRSSITELKSTLKILPNHSLSDFNSSSLTHDGIRVNKRSPDSSISKHRVGKRSDVSRVNNKLNAVGNTNSNYKLPLSDSKSNLSASYENRNGECFAEMSALEGETPNGRGALVNTKVDCSPVGGSDHKWPTYKENKSTKLQRNCKQSYVSDSKTGQLGFQDRSFCLADEVEDVSKCFEGSCTPTFKNKMETCVQSEVKNTIDHYPNPLYKNNGSDYMDENNTRKFPLGLSPISGKGQDQKCVLSKVRGRLDHLKKSDHNISNNHSGTSQCTGHSLQSNCRSQTQGCFSSEVNKGLDQSQISDSSNNLSTRNDKKIGKSSSASSSSDLANGKTLCSTLADVKRRTDHCEIPDCVYTMTHHNEKVRESFTGSHGSCRNLTQNCVSSEIKRELLQKYLLFKLQELEKEVCFI